MKNASFIISVDGSFEMTNNFFEHLLNNSFAKESEIIVINDCIDNIHTLNYLNQLNKEKNNVKLINLETKLGYGKANNIGVENAQNEYIFFINIDVFASRDCFEKMYDCLCQGNADCVQPLLIWPQNNRIQCAGTFFGEYYKKHLFAGRRPESIDFSAIPSERQALTSALYAMKKDVFLELGMFDEFYYNKLESFELSFKLTLAKKKCVCLSTALAYHSQGAGRNQYFFDFYQQEAYFWTRMGNKVLPDIKNYYKMQLTPKMTSSVYNVVAITQTRNTCELIKSLGFKFISYTEINGINPQKINLYDLLPFSCHKSESPILFFVENITNLLGNKKWFELRPVRDIVLDTYGNVLYVDEI